MLQQSTVSVAVLARWAVRPNICAGWWGGRGWVERSAGGCESGGERGRGTGVDAEHVFVGGHGTGNLDELDEEEHGDPGELERGPDGEEEAVGIGVDDAAEGGGEDVAFLRCSRRESGEI